MRLDHRKDMATAEVLREGEEGDEEDGGGGGGIPVGRRQVKSWLRMSEGKKRRKNVNVAFFLSSVTNIFKNREEYC